MIGWRDPVALWGLTLLAVPVAIHLLRTQRATRLLFPSVRFVRASRSAAIRLRPPSDVVLMVLRMAAVAAAVCAVAGPVLLTEARTRTWETRIARAVIVHGMAADRSGDALSRKAEEERSAAAYGLRIDDGDLAGAIRRASAWLLSSPPARREVVVVSELREGSVDPRVAARLPPGVGLRFERVGAGGPSRAVPPEPLLGVAGAPARRLTTVLDGAATVATVETVAPAGAVGGTTTATGAATDGLRVVVSAGQAPEIASLLRAVSTAGAPAPDPDQPLTVILGNEAGLMPSDPAGVARGWQLDAVLRLRDDRSLDRLGSAEMTPLDAAAPWVAILRNEAGHAVVRAAASGRDLVVHVDASVDSYQAAVIVRAALETRRGPLADAQAEPLTIADDRLHAWARESGPVDRGAWRNADADARWLWAAALAALAVEQWLRSRVVRRRVEAGRAAA